MPVVEVTKDDGSILHIEHKCKITQRSGDIYKSKYTNGWVDGRKNPYQYCNWCGENLHYRKYLTTGFDGYLKSLGYSENQIEKAWRMTVVLLDDPTSNKLAERDIMQITCKDILEFGHFYVFDEFLHKETS